MTNAIRLKKRREPLLTVFKGPSLELGSLTHIEGEITVVKREKELSNYEITIIYGKLQGQCVDWIIAHFSSFETL